MKLFEGQYNFQDELDKTLEKKPDEKSQEYYEDLAKKNAGAIIQRIKDEIQAEEVKPENVSPVNAGPTEGDINDDWDKPANQYYNNFNKFRKKS